MLGRRSSSCVLISRIGVLAAELAELKQRRVNVDEAYSAVNDFGIVGFCFPFGPGDNEWNPSRFFPQGVLADAILFSLRCGNCF